MGRRTFQSLKKPLDGRDNIVVSRDIHFRAEGAIVEPSFAAALNRARLLARARGTDEIVVIGGTQVFADALSEARFIYKTEVRGAPAGDAQFPAIDWDAWKEVSREALPRSPQDDFAAELVVLERK
jgi:dihydrofolate reductase